MAEYKYAPLDQMSRAIRLLTLLPGSHGDPIRIRIVPALLPDETELPSNRASIAEIRDSLPSVWNAYETLGGRILFQKLQEPFSTSWDHPTDPTFAKEKHSESSRQPDDGQHHDTTTWEALSYEWGTDLNTESAQVEEAGRCNTLQVRIRKNLAEALRYLRYSHNARTLWVDSLCINQHDRVERSAQVLRMGSIYGRATRVIIWLGAPAAQSAKAMSTLNFLASQLEYTLDTQFLPAPGCTRPDWYLTDSDLGFDDQTLDALYQLLGYGWFQRLWVLQEAQLAGSDSVVKCGHDEVQWPLFRRALLCLFRRRQGLSKAFRARLAAHARFTVDFLVRAPIEELLSVSSSQYCSDERDRIYGILKIAPPGFASLIQPDYGVDTTEVYKRAFLIHCRHYRRLTLLQHCGDPEGASPSWVPNWARGINYHASYYGCQASGLSDPRYSVGENNLEVCGIVVSKVCFVETQEITSMSDLARLIRRMDIDTLKSRQHPSGGTVLDALIQSFAFGRTGDRMPILEYPLASEIRDFLETLLEEDVQKRQVTSRTLHERFESEIVGKLMGKSIVALDGRQYMGVAPKAVLKGDIVSVILGCDLPMVLRRSTDNALRIVGPCFIHGLMNGEAVLGPLPSTTQLRVAANNDGIFQPQYMDSRTSALSYEDPRLAHVPVPKDWEAVEQWQWTRDDPIQCVRYRNVVTGEVINTDPRMSVEALRLRGVDLTCLWLS